MNMKHIRFNFISFKIFKCFLILYFGESKEELWNFRVRTLERQEPYFLIRQSVFFRKLHD